MLDPRTTTVAEYLLARLKAMGLHHIFGVPGDYVLGLINRITESEITYVGTCNELNAAYAADGYARVKGVGALVTTYGVGELSALNGVAGAYAERVPLVVITGAPSAADFRKQPRLHHTLGDYDIPLRMFEAITVDHACLDSAATAPAEIDRVLTSCLAQRRPVYLRICSDIVDLPCAKPGAFHLPTPAPSDPGALAEAVAETKVRLARAQRPLVLAGVDLRRFGFEREFEALIEATNLPFLTLILAKGVLSERHPRFLGVYEGAQSCERLLARAQAADLIVQLGNGKTDINTGGFTTNADPELLILADLRSVTVGHHLYENVALPDFMRALAGDLGPWKAPMEIQPASAVVLQRQSDAPQIKPAAAMTADRLFDRMSLHLQPGAIVLAETGVSLFCAAEMLLPDGALFIGQAFYSSIGYTLGATLGACLAAPHRQVVLFIGDGAFQMVAQELSTVIRHGLQPIMVVLNNDGYTFERLICDGPFNDLQPWQYARLPEIFGGKAGKVIETEGDLDNALDGDRSGGLVFLEVRTERLDCPPTIQRASQAMANNVHLGSNT